MQVGSVQTKVTSLIIQPAKQADRGYYDPADTNKDGVVSAAEALAYSLTHPQFNAHKAASTVHPPPAYTPRATSRTNPFQHGYWDLKA